MIFFELDIDDPRKLLDSVEKNVTLLDGGLVLGILRVRPVGDHDSADFVNPTKKEKI